MKAVENQKKCNGYKILKNLFDENTMEEIAPFFKYDEIDPGIICGFGRIKGYHAYAFAQSLDLSGGMMSKSQAFKLMKLYFLAEKTGAPIVGVFNSKGASLISKNQALEAYVKISQKCCQLSGVVPQISLVVGMCYGTMASVVSCSDIVIITKDGKLGFDIGGENSDAEKSCIDGTSDIMAENENEAIEKARNLISMLPSNNLCGNRTVEFNEQENLNISIVNEKNKHEIINKICDKNSFIEIKKDFGKHFITGFASIKGKVCGIICSNPAVLDCADYDSCSKVAKFIMMCDSFSIPLITLADTQNFSSINGASKIFCAYSNSTCIKLSVITGKIYSGTAYTALCGRGMQDLIFCWTTGGVSALKPQTAVEILWKDRLHGDGVNFKQKRKELEEEYIKTEVGAIRSCEIGLADYIIYPDETREKLALALESLENKRERTLPKKHTNINM